MVVAVKKTIKMNVELSLHALRVFRRQPGNWVMNERKLYVSVRNCAYNFVELFASNP